MHQFHSHNSLYCHHIVLVLLLLEHNHWLHKYFLLEQVLVLLEKVTEQLVQVLAQQVLDLAQQVQEQELVTEQLVQVLELGLVLLGLGLGLGLVPQEQEQEPQVLEQVLQEQGQVLVQELGQAQVLE
jgi:hypothetical protein